MLNINLKIEAKNSWVLDNVLEIGDDLPRSEELKMFYDIFEDCFLKKHLQIKESKRMKKDEKYNPNLSKEENKLRLKKTKHSDSIFYLNNKIAFLEKPFPNEDNKEKIRLLTLQIERISEIYFLTKKKISDLYFNQTN